MNMTDIELITAQAIVISQLQAEVERLEELEARAVVVVLDLRAIITRLMGELKTVTAERDELRDLRKLGYDLRLKQALTNINATRKAADEW